MINRLNPSKLETWLRERNMSTNRFTELVGCSRPVIWKVKRGLPISPMYASRVRELTNGEIEPEIELVGRRKKTINNSTQKE